MLVRVLGGITRSAMFVCIVVTCYNKKMSNNQKKKAQGKV